jgi:hypothetical protein
MSVPLPVLEPSRGEKPGGARRIRLQFEWAIANFIPLLLVPVAGWFMRSDLSYDTRAAVAYPVALGSIALVQGLALAQYVPWGMHWTFATLAGLLAGGGAGALLLGMLGRLGWSELLAVAAAHAAGGTLVAGSQWLLLRTRAERAWLWIAAGAATSGVFAAALFPFWGDRWLPGHVADIYPGSREMTTLIRVVAASGLVTGSLLARLLRHSPRK